MSLIGTSSKCPWCTPGTERLVGKMCSECWRVYQLHLAADLNGGLEEEATAWTRAAAKLLRNPTARKPMTVEMLAECEED